MALDPFSGLDPAAPATTLRKVVRYVYVEPPPSPPEVLIPDPPPPSISYSGGTVQHVYIIDTGTSVSFVTYEEFMRR